VFVRVLRFTDVTAERVESLVARIDETGPPPGVPIKKLQLVFDEAQGRAVVLQYFDNERACGPGPTPSRRWIGQRRPAAASRWTWGSSRSRGEL
jgi:hypothetical protein